MEKATKHPTRKDRQLRVPVLPGEEREIKRLAAATGLPVAAYLRNVGLGYRVRGMVDHKRVEELARINADLECLGGVLKLWLAGDPRTAAFGEAAIHAVLSRMEKTQDEMHAVMSAVVMPTTRR